MDPAQPRRPLRSCGLIAIKLEDFISKPVHRFRVQSAARGCQAHSADSEGAGVSGAVGGGSGKGAEQWGTLIRVTGTPHKGSRLSAMVSLSATQVRTSVGRSGKAGHCSASLVLAMMF